MPTNLEHSKSLYFIIGLPFSGKGTQADNLSKYLNCPSLSVAQIIKNQIEKNTPLGIQAKTSQKKFKTIENQIIHKTIADCIRETRPSLLIIDGFPRNMEQYNSFKRISEFYGYEIKRIFYLDAPNDVLLNRYEKKKDMFEKKDALWNRDFNFRMKRLRQDLSTLMYDLDKEKSLIKINGAASIKSVFESMKSHI